MKKQPQNGVDIAGFMTRIQEQIAALEKKLDVLISRPSFQPKPSFQPPVDHASGSRQQEHIKARPMYQATCADCKNACEIPFKPSGDRPVYCKECFSRRKARNAVKVQAGNDPKQASPVQAIAQAVIHAAEPVQEKKKAAVVKRPVAKKKLVLKEKEMTAFFGAKMSASAPGRGIFLKEQ